MSRNTWHQRICQLARCFRTQRKPQRRQRQLRTMAFEQLSERITPAVTAVFSPGAALLSVFGDALDNTITVSRNAAGNLLVNGGAVNVVGGTPTVANTASIQIFGQGGQRSALAQ